MSAHSKLTRSGSIAVLAAVFVGNLGCTSMSSWKPSKMFSLDSTWPFGDKDASPEGTPVRMVGTWSDTVLTQAGQKPQRGFGGRIMFYEKDEKEPILVDGQLVVYAFDESGRDPTDNKPTRRYVFPAEQMSLHMSKSELGASYSFWLPWDEAGGPKADISLICRFEPKGGAVVTSEQTRHRLPGSMPALAAGGPKKPPKLPDGVPSKPVVQTLQSLQTERTEERNAQLTSYEAASPADPQVGPTTAAQDANQLPARRLTATTINLPLSFQMPSAAAIGNQSPPAAINVQPAGQPIQQPLPNQQLPQQAPATYPPAAQSTAVPPMAPNRPFSSVPPQMNTGGTAPQTTQLSFNPTFGIAAGIQPMMQSRVGVNTTPAGQIPLQQQMMPQQTLQQRTLQSQPATQQVGQQMPVQSGATATVSYPAAGQYLR